MVSLEPPWPGLAVVAPRAELWPALRALGLARGCAAPPVPAPLFPAPETPLEARLRAAGLRPSIAEEVAAWLAWEAPTPRVRFLTAAAPEWPSALDGLPRGPVAFAYEGDLGVLARPLVAIVGSRACTSYGTEWAARLATAVVAAGGVVVSGLAAGIDLAAHGAAGGATVAVLGQGIGAPMPGWQRRARENLLARGGLVISECPPGAPANTFTFPVRNRIIAALARVVVVVEAGERSGARNTATHAGTYGRPVLAVPGPLGAAASFGCLDLIEQRKAALVRGPQTVLQAADLLAPSASSHAGAGGLAEAAGPVWTALGAPRTPEDLCALTGLPFARVMEALGVLELTGRAIRLPGRRYQARTR